MRRTHRLLRFGFALQAILLLAIQLADGSGVHRCPDHDSGLGVLALGSAPAGAHHHGGHHDGSGKHQGLCPCLGACHSTTVALAPAGVIAFAELAAGIASTVPAPVAAVRTQHARRLPYSIGPPAPVPSDFA